MDNYILVENTSISSFFGGGDKDLSTLYIFRKGIPLYGVCNPPKMRDRKENVQLLVDYFRNGNKVSY